MEIFSKKRLKVLETRMFVKFIEVEIINPSAQTQTLAEKLNYLREHWWILWNTKPPRYELGDLSQIMSPKKIIIAATTALLVAMMIWANTGDGAKVDGGQVELIEATG